MVIIYGNTGPDTLTGGSGNDIIYDRASGGNASSPSGNDRMMRRLPQVKPSSSTARGQETYFITRMGLQLVSGQEPSLLPLRTILS